MTPHEVIKLTIHHCEGPNEYLFSSLANCDEFLAEWAKYYWNKNWTREYLLSCWNNDETAVGQILNNENCMRARHYFIYNENHRYTLDYEGIDNATLPPYN